MHMRCACPHSETQPQSDPSLEVALRAKELQEHTLMALLGTASDAYAAANNITAPSWDAAETCLGRVMLNNEISDAITETTVDTTTKEDEPWYFWLGLGLLVCCCCGGCCWFWCVCCGCYSEEEHEFACEYKDCGFRFETREELLQHQIEKPSNIIAKAPFTGKRGAGTSNAKQAEISANRDAKLNTAEENRITRSGLLSSNKKKRFYSSDPNNYFGFGSAVVESSPIGRAQYKTETTNQQSSSVVTWSTPSTKAAKALPSANQ